MTDFKKGQLVKIQKAEGIIPHVDVPTGALGVIIENLYKVLDKNKYKEYGVYVQDVGIKLFNAEELVAIDEV